MKNERKEILERFIQTFFWAQRSYFCRVHWHYCCCLLCITYLIPTDFLLHITLWGEITKKVQVRHIYIARSPPFLMFSWGWWESEKFSLKHQNFSWFHLKWFKKFHQKVRNSDILMRISHFLMISWEHEKRRWSG